MAVAGTGRTGDEQTQAVRLRDQARDRAPPRWGRVWTGSRRGIRASFAQYCRQLDEYLSTRGRRRAATQQARPAFDRSREPFTGERGRDAAQGERALRAEVAYLGKLRALRSQERR